MGDNNNNTAIAPERRAELLEIIRNFRLMDDTFMSKVFEDKECSELLLRVILGRDDLTVVRVVSQFELKNLQGRSARLDIYAVDNKGKQYDIEVQRSDEGGNPKRARYKTQGTLENLNIYLVGDLKYGRTVHSLLMAMRHFNPTFHFIAPEELKMPEEYKIYCKEHHIKYKEYTDFNEETIADADILYMTRVQRERFTDLMEYERVKDVYILRNKMLEHTRPNLRILHPLPRVNEIAYDVDENPKAYYFQQAQNGLYARQAILCDVLGITLNDVIEDAKK